MALEILYKDDYIAAVNKPHGLLVHPTSIARDASEFALQLVRDQLGQKVYPVHRLDRKTAGVLLFALSAEALRDLQTMFANRKVEKKYLAIVRGYTDDEGKIEKPVANKRGVEKEATTNYKTIARTELPFASGQHPSSRYSLVDIEPETGRMHQIRKHFRHIRHPIIGDRPYGCNKQNRFFKEKWQMTTLLLHAYSLAFTHPVVGRRVAIAAAPQVEFLEAANLMGWQNETFRQAYFF